MSMSPNGRASSSDWEVFSRVFMPDCKASQLKLSLGIYTAYVNFARPSLYAKVGEISDRSCTG